MVSEEEETSGPPPHVAIIMDGNGRWAKKRHLPRTVGHRQGVEAVRTAIETAVRVGVKHLTLFSFSSENWKRPEEEIGVLMGLLRAYLASEVDTLHEKGVRLRFIGDTGRLSKDIVEQLKRAESKTAGNETLFVNVALNYGGRDEIVRAARRLAEEAANGSISPEEIDEAAFSDRLYAPDTPDPDILIRTSGEKRISNFLLWQTAYSEFVFLDVLWPDFSEDDFRQAIEEFHRRERRYGGL